MIYQSDTIKTIVSGASIATAAGISSSEWANYHTFVRYGEDDMVGNTNIGRLPIVTIREVTSNYEFQAEPNHFGTRETIFIIRIYVATFGNRSETQWKRLQDIKNACMIALTTNLNIGSTDMEVLQPVISQMAVYQDIRVTTQTSYDNNYEEGN